MPLRINQQISDPKGLTELLHRLIAALSVFSGERRIDDRYKFFLDKDFTADGSTNYHSDTPIYVDPLAVEPGTDPQTFTLIDVLKIIQAIFNVLNSEEFRTYANKDEVAYQEFYKERKDAKENYFDKKRHEIQERTGAPEYRQKELIEIAEKLLEVLGVLTAPIIVEEKPERIDRDNRIPQWLEDIDRAPFRKNWEPIKEVFSVDGETGFLEVAYAKFKDIKDENTFPGIALKNGEVVSLVALRKFLNKWAKDIIDEDVEISRLFPKRKIFIERMEDFEFFPDNSRIVAQKDLEHFQDLDPIAIKAFKELLVKQLEKFKKKKPEEEINLAASAAEDGESESPDEPNKEPLPKTPEEAAKLKDEIIAYQKHIQIEAVRVEVIARNFVLRLNNFPLNMPTDLANSDAFRYMEREISSEILELLNRDPHALDDENRRSIVIHSFLFRLMANPKFQTYLALLKDKYASIEANKLPNLDEKQKTEFKIQFIENLNKEHNGNVEDVLEEIYANIKVDAIPNLTPAQKAALTKQLAARLSKNHTLNIDLFLAEANAALSISQLIQLTAAEQLALKQILTDQLLSNPNADVNTLLVNGFAALRASQFPNITPEQEAAVIQSILPKLTRNSLDHIDDILNESYAALIAANIPDIDPKQKEQLRQQLIDTLSQNPHANINQIISRFAQVMEKGADLPNKDFDPKNLSKAHFAELLTQYYKLSFEEQSEFFDAADLLLFMRISPDRVLRFTPDQFDKIFGKGFSKLPLDQQNELAQLLNSYLLLRRQWFEKEYNSNSISQSQDAVLGDRPLTDDELKLLLARKEQFKNIGLDPKHFVRAAILTPTQLDSFVESGAGEGAATDKAADILQQERKEMYAAMLQNLIAEEDEEFAKQLAIATGIQIAADGILTSSQKATLRMYLESSADLSPFEMESGIVLDDQNQVIRTEAQAEQAYTSGSTPKPGVTALKALTDEGAALIGGAAISAVLPGVGFLIPKKLQQDLGKIIVVGGTVAAGSAVAAIGEVASALGSLGVVGAGGAVGGLFGTVAGFAVGGPFGAILGGIGGGLAGAGGTAAAQSGVLGNIVGGSGSGITAQGAFGASGAGGAVPANVAGLGGNLAKLGNAATRLITATPAGASVAAFVGITALGTVVAYSTYQVAFLPPKIIYSQSTVVNKYVALSKTADPNTAPNPTSTTPVTYTIKIDAKEGYKIEITNISDVSTVALKNKSAPVPTVNAPTIDPKVTLDSAATDGSNSKTIQYQQSFDNKFTDALVTNTVQVTFNATGNGTTISDSTTAQASVCFGDCPKPASGCWPTTGKIGQNPFGPFDHNNYGEDAFDIMAPIGTPIYAPFPGNVCAANDDGYWSDDGVSGGGYGNMLTLVTDSSAGNYKFTFGHLSKYADGLVAGNCSGGSGLHVNAGDLIGYVGTSGHSSGPHLHYQVGPEKNKNRTSVLRTLIPPADKDILYVYGKADPPVVSCYDTRSTSNTGGAAFK